MIPGEAENCDIQEIRNEDGEDVEHITRIYPVRKIKVRDSYTIIWPSDKLHSERGWRTKASGGFWGARDWDIRHPPTKISWRILKSQFANLVAVSGLYQESLLKAFLSCICLAVLYTFSLAMILKKPYHASATLDNKRAPIKMPCKETGCPKWGNHGSALK